MNRRFALWSVLVLVIAVAGVRAQETNPSYRYEIGMFAEDFRFGRVSPTLDMPGAGARVSVFPTSPVQLEIEMSYNFAQTFTSSWTNGFATDLLDTHLRVLRGLGGMKFDKHLGKRPLRIFAVTKVGFISFSSSTSGIPQGFSNPQVPATGGGNDFVVYPGGGLEYSFGRFGLRFDVGDDLYFDHGHRYNNIRGTFGPTFRF